MSRGSPRFLDQRARIHTLGRLAIAFVVADVGYAVATTSKLLWLSRGLELETLGRIVGLSVLLSHARTLTFFGFGALLLVTLVQAHSNAAAIAARPLATSARALVGWFCVPIANLFVPFHAVRQLWAASSAGTDPVPAPASFTRWWVGWVVAWSFVAAGRYPSGGDLPRGMALLWMVTLASAYAAWQAFATVRALDDLQRARWNELRG